MLTTGSTHTASTALDLQNHPAKHDEDGLLRSNSIYNGSTVDDINSAVP